jgi:crotonobetainyl-CoA:carnitine CoA-transferase CaiB-like acyl-CoA transferase
MDYRRSCMAGHLLSGIKVIDLTHYIAGPYCSKLMAALGAEVIKVEKPGEGDGARKLGPFPADKPNPEASGLFLYLNTHKKSITVNLKTNTGVKIFKDLIQDADILIENFEPRVMPSLGLDYNTLKKINPRLVMTSISNFGQTGPYRDMKAEEINVFALGGLMNLLGDEGREPLKFGGSASQYMAGIAGFSGSMVALHHAEKTGMGQHVDVSIMECLVSCHFQDVIEYSYTGRLLPRYRRMLVMPCKDGFVAATILQRQWPRLAKLLEMPELLEDPRFETMESRRIHADELEAHILPWIIERTKEEIYHAAQAVGLSFGYIATSEDLLKATQYKAREFFVDIYHPVVGRLTYPGIPFKANDLANYQSRAPLLGEHNEEIYCAGLGLTKDDLVRLRASGIV